MKQLGFVILLIFAFSNSIFAQDNHVSPHLENMSFYMQLAKKDAAYEQSLVLGNEKDELDFWKDQKRYEQDLKKSDEAAYRAYMTVKKDAYHEHFLSCFISCNHTKQNLERAKEYLSQPTIEFDEETSEKRIVQNLLE